MNLSRAQASTVTEKLPEPVISNQGGVKEYDYGPGWGIILVHQRPWRFGGSRGRDVQVTLVRDKNTSLHRTLGEATRAMIARRADKKGK